MSATSALDSKRCDFCYKTPEQLEEGKKLKLCSGCSVIYYCSKKCQKQAWKTHKTACKTLQRKVTFECHTTGEGNSPTVGQTKVRIKQGNTKLPTFTFSPSRPKKTPSIDLTNTGQIQDLLDKQDYHLIFDTLKDYNPHRNPLENIEEKIAIITPYLDQCHVYLFYAMGHLLYQKYQLKKDTLNSIEQKQALAETAQYIFLGNIHTKLAECCCSDLSVSGSATQIMMEFSIQEIAEKKEGLKKLFYPKIIDHLRTINLNQLPSPQWLAVRGMAAFLGRHGLKSEREWQPSRQEVIEKLLSQLSS